MIQAGQLVTAIFKELSWFCHLEFSARTVWMGRDCEQWSIALSTIPAGWVRRTLSTRVSFLHTSDLFLLLLWCRDHLDELKLLLFDDSRLIQISFACRDRVRLLDILRAKALIAKLGVVNAAMEHFLLWRASIHSKCTQLIVDLPGTRVMESERRS